MNRTLLVTGASSGIGRATALLAASRGYAVVVHYNQQEAAAQRVVAQIRERHQQRALAVRADLSDPPKSPRSTSASIASSERSRRS